MIDRPSASRSWFAGNTWLRTALGPPVFLSLTLVTLGGFLGGALFWVMFDKALDATSTDAFCVSCHSMRSTVYQEFQGTPHASNALGVRATCADCHVPHAFTPKMVRKVQAIGELWAEMTGKVDTPEKFERHRWAMAEREWARLTANRSAECRTCHDPAAMDLARQPPAAAAMHRMRLLTEQATCIDCHKGIAHQRPKPPNG